MKKNFLLGLLFPVFILSAMVTPVFAESPASGSSQTTQLQYTISSGEGAETTTKWTWKVPATQTFTITDLERNGTVSIGPATEGKFLVMDNGTTINIKLNSANGFKLMTNAGEKSTIPYQIKKNGTTNSLVQNTNVLSFTAGQSPNTGVSQELIFFTDEDSMKNPTLIGTHTDTITFRAQVTPPPGVVFSDGTRLAWDQLKLAENGTKYGYDASLITDTSIGDYAFRDCTSLTNITIPEGVTNIGQSAFHGCSSLTSIEMPASVTSIETQAFRDSTSLTDINYTGTQEQWNTISKSSNWDLETGNYTIHCTDGDIVKS